MSNPEIAIAGRKIGSAYSPFVIAELSANHNGSLARALEIMEAAKQAGADAVKLQTYTADTITIDHDSSEFVIQSGPWSGRRLYDLYGEAHTPWDWHEKLFRKGRELGLIVFSSPFDFSAVSLLEELEAPAYKIASFEIIDLPLVRHCAATGKPLIISTGMAGLADIEAAVSIARAVGNDNILLLHCTSGYPTPPEESDLRTVPHMAEAFGVPVGLSDHTLGLGVSIAAVALGAVAIEKHLTCRRDEGGPDAAFSLEPDEFRLLCENVQIAWRALGQVRYYHAASEAANLQFRRSLYVVANMRAGDRFSAENVRSIRPGYGLSPRFYDSVLGRRVTCDVRRGTPLSWELIASPGDDDRAG
jgi:pseudaminic acid synthase